MKRTGLIVAIILLTAGPGRVEAALQLEVSLTERTLQVVVADEVIEEYEVTIGKETYPTPTGEFEIRKIVWNPTWVPPNSKWARGKSAKGPWDEDNPMKMVKIFFKEPDYYIHGTGDVESLGSAKSHGCLRMRPTEAAEVARLIMEHGGKPQPERWFKRIFQSKRTQAVYLSESVPIVVRD